ncbi:hypothetical protein A0H81_14760 [Grifola frondosa]|uniref:PX domain-containing protein n=1 Tax=Grifola frondosa TaxID=5627 RepID=A0A1C7LKP8_GRIFR|nr:hypothetical protein A0H81_14760 [Grifola frondosa]
MDSASTSHLTSPPSSSDRTRPLEHAKGLLVLIPDKIDVEEESRLYDEICESADAVQNYPHAPPYSPPSPREAVSVFSKDIWLGDNSGESLAFARDVEIAGWTSVGDKLGGAYVVYDCAIRTKEGTVIHTHKRYSAFAELYARLRATLPVSAGNLRTLFTPFTRSSGKPTTFHSYSAAKIPSGEVSPKLFGPSEAPPATLAFCRSSSS